MKCLPRNFRFALVLLLATMAISIATTTAWAQDKTFALVPGIPGGSLDTRHPDWIEVVSIQQEWTATMRRNSCELEVVKGLDIAGPRLWAAAVMGQSFNEIRVEVTRANDSKIKIYEIRLQNAQISSIQTAGVQLFTETVTFKAANMTLSYYPQNPDGTTGTPVTTQLACD